MEQLKKCFVLALILLGVALSERGQSAPRLSRDERSVRQVVGQVQEAWNAHDGKAFASPFAADADYVVVNGMYAKGRDEVEKGHTGLFNSIYKDSRNVAIIRSVRFLRKDVAVVHVEWNLEFRVGGKTEKGHALNTMIMTKDKGIWSIAAFQNTPIQPSSR